MTNDIIHKYYNNIYDLYVANEIRFRNVLLNFIKSKINSDYIKYILNDVLYNIIYNMLSNNSKLPVIQEEDVEI